MCDHTGNFSSPGLAVVQQGQGVTIFVPVVCGECGDVRLRQPMPDAGDQRKLGLMAPPPGPLPAPARG